jgi:hypothetical protein
VLKQNVIFRHSSIKLQYFLILRAALGMAERYENDALVGRGKCRMVMENNCAKDTLGGMIRRDEARRA